MPHAIHAARLPTRSARRLAVAAPLWLCALLLAACGGDSSFCFTDGSGSFSAGYNSSNCPPEADAQPAQAPQTHE